MNCIHVDCFFDYCYSNILKSAGSGLRFTFTFQDKTDEAMVFVGSISAALSCLVYPPRGRSTGSFPEQRLVVEPMIFACPKLVKNSLNLSFGNFYSFLLDC